MVINYNYQDYLTTFSMAFSNKNVGLGQSSGRKLSFLP